MGEPCRRYRFADVEAVDKAGELTYKKSLLAFLSQMQKKDQKQNQASKGLIGEKRLIQEFLAKSDGKGVSGGAQETNDPT